ncbi:MAG TPA: hypothetical protein VE684_12820 [Crenalkalicoccus sp.]|nr:hypothetical protein [Crenalkalicoccus sp.]
MTANRALKLLAWPAAIWIAYELLWYEQYKLTGPTLVFEVLGAWLGVPEIAFRWCVGLMEVTAAMLVLIPRTRTFGAAFAFGIMSGAIFFHVISPLGIDPYHDGGVLFHEACLTWAVALFVMLAERDELLGIAGRFVPALRPAT